MSTFASIAVLSKPTVINPDWEFEMEGLKFAVHDGMVELNQEIRDFERFSTALNNVFLLIDSIDSNNGRLDEAVYSLVNQNNELAEALGIYTPFNLKSDAGQFQAGCELRMALEADENQGNDQQKKDGESSSGDEKGFFAKAWEAIKNFFGKIFRAIKNFFVSSEAKEKADDEKNREANEKLSKMTPEQVRKAFEDAVKTESAGISLSKGLAESMVKSAENIANVVYGLGNQISDPLSYFDLVISKGSYCALLSEAKEDLEKFGYTLHDGKNWGQDDREPKKTGKCEFYIQEGSREEAIKSWATEPGKLIGPSGSYRTRMKEVCSRLKKASEAIANLTEQFSKDKVIDEIIAKRGPSLKDRFKALFGNKEATDTRGKIKIAQGIGKDLASAVSTICGCLNECENRMGATCKAVESIIIKRYERIFSKQQQQLDAYKKKEEASKKSFNAPGSVSNDTPNDYVKPDSDNRSSDYIVPEDHSDTSFSGDKPKYDAGKVVRPEPEKEGYSVANDHSDVNIGVNKK